MSSSSFVLRLATEPVVFATLEEIARQGARRALQKAIKQEVAEEGEAGPGGGGEGDDHDYGILSRK
jgi:hypothetical protein